VEEPVDVVVVGARPVGVLTAIELTLGNVRVLATAPIGAPL
jgi:glycine/D-amino acid oxidase-like deaminating enzyme